MKPEKNKSVNLVSFSEGKLSEVTPLTVPITQPLAVLKGDFASITEQLQQWQDSSQQPPVWLDIEITSDEYLHDIQRKKFSSRPNRCRWKCCWCVAVAPSVNAFWPAFSGKR